MLAFGVAPAALGLGGAVLCARGSALGFVAITAAAVPLVVLARDEGRWDLGAILALAVLFAVGGALAFVGARR